MSDSRRIREDVADHVKRKQIRSNDASWRGASELPSAEELMKMTPTLMPEPRDELGTDSKERYLERLYKAYRHEGIELLRRAINNYRRRKTEDRASYVYSNARVRGYTFARQGAACRIAFSTRLSQTRVDWFDPDEGRLKVGGLVALSNDHFKSQCLVGVVAARPLYGGLVPDRTKGEDDWTPPRIDIFWSRTEDSVWDPAEDMVMIEARSAYYEPVRYAMLGLQHAAQTMSKFDKYLVTGHKEDPQHESFDPGIKVPPPPTSAAFDVSQNDAYLRMINKELAIVQGPPGTGKTFTSVIALEDLVKRSACSPLIISAHTNHALDQLLRECMSVGMHVARLGSRTQDEEIEKRTLFNIARQTLFGKKRGFAHEKARNETIRFIEEARDLCFAPELVPAKTFLDYGIITQEQYVSLSEDEWEMAEDVNDSPRPPPDGVESGLEAENLRAEQDLLRRWLATQTEEDRSHLYKPPTNQYEPAPAGPVAADYHTSVSDGSDLEEVEGPDRKVTAAPEEKNRKLDGQFVSLHLGLTGSVQGGRSMVWWNTKAQQLLNENDDLYEIQPDQRGAVYRYIRQQLVERIAGDILRPRLQEYKVICEEIKIDQDCRSVEIIQKEKIRIIGCTTTGLTKYRGLISGLEPRVLLIEEAAETPEPNVSAALVPSLEQLILVGDHQQLAPGVKVEEMKRYLEISLFERLVRSGVPFSQLQVQRRMAPPIREVVQAFYPNLSDHKIVGDINERPLVRGIDHRVWWFQHRWPDSRHNTSSINVDEALMIVRLYQYLVQNGLGVNQVTVLSFYKAQVEMIKSFLSKDGFFGRIRTKQSAQSQNSRSKQRQQQPAPRTANKAADWDSVVRTVDGFQGEQNEVIILSAVRSCSSSGFVAVENRAVVALSRAKRGMYVFGNEETLLGDQAGRETWGKVFDVFTKRAMKGESFPITCVKHERVTEILDVDAWSRFKDGGCDLPCEGDRVEDHDHCREHACHLSCHPPGQTIVCRQPCERELPCKHKCKRACGKPCKCSLGCDEPVIKNSIRPSPIPTRTTSTAPAWTPNLALRSSPNTPAAIETQQSEPEFRFRDRFCGLDGEAPQLASSHPVLQPVVRETWKRTMLDVNGTRRLAETIRQDYVPPLIDVSVPETTQEAKEVDKQEDKQEEDEERKDDWLIEL